MGLPNDPALWFLAAHISLFAVVAWQNRCFAWLGGALLLWLAADLLAAWLLPGVPLRRLAALYPAQLYIAAASVCLIPYIGREGAWLRFRRGNAWLALYALACWAVALGTALLAVLIGWMYPAGASPYWIGGLVQLYFFSPPVWLCLQLLLMLLFYLHRVSVGGQDARLFDGRQLLSGGLLVLVVLTGGLLQSLPWLKI